MGYAPFKLNYGYMPQTGQHISIDTTFKGVKQFVQQAVWNLLDAHDTMLEHGIEQTHYSNKCHKPGIEYQIMIWYTYQQRIWHCQSIGHESSCLNSLG